MSEEGRTPFLHRVGEVGAEDRQATAAEASVRVAVQLGIAIVIFGFLVLTVVSQWDEVRQEGVHFEVLWLPPALVVLDRFYFLGALGWDLILRFLGHRIGLARPRSRGASRCSPATSRQRPLRARADPALRAGRGAAAYDARQHRLRAGDLRLRRGRGRPAILISHPDLQDQPLRWGVLLVVPAAILVLQPRVFGPLANWLLASLRSRAAAGDDAAARRARDAALLRAPTGASPAVGVYLVARSVRFIPFSDLPVVGSAQAIGYVAALVTLVAPAGLGVRDSAFAWTVKVAVPSRSFAVGSLIAIAVRAVLTVVEVVYVGRRHRSRPPPRLEPDERRRALPQEAPGPYSGTRLIELEGGQRESHTGQWPVA